MTKTYQLNDGVVIELSTRSNNRTGYTGASLSVAWTLDSDKPFIAACGNPSDPAIHEQLHARERTCWHGGHYSDAREAAYVTALFKSDPVRVDDLIHHEGAYTDFPADLYDLPEGMSQEEAVELLDAKHIAKKGGTRQKRAKIIRRTRLNDTPAREGFYQKYDHTVAKALAERFTRELLSKYFDESNGFTLNDVELVFGSTENNHDLSVYA